ncbi:MAG: hypothetical protein ACYC5M_06830 [Anaerolineae bacterium]
MVEAILDSLRFLTPRQIALGLAGVSALLLVIEERRLVLVPLLVQYILLGLLGISSFFYPIVIIRIGVGIAICLMLYITAVHVERGLRRVGHTPNPAWDSTAAPSQPALSFEMGPIFRLVVAALGGIAAYGLWRALPFQPVPDEFMLTAYWLICTGLLMTLISADPLRMGFGILTAINGFELLYLSLEQSLVIIGLLGVIDLVLALAISVCAENWLAQLRGEAPQT